jgi:hypothetical protein
VKRVEKCREYRCEEPLRFLTADRSGIVSSRGCLEGRNRMRPFVFSHKVTPGGDVEILVCATGAACGRVRHTL